MPFQIDSEEVDSTMRELIRLEFKQLENIGDFLSGLNGIKHLWARSYLLKRANCF